MIRDLLQLYYRACSFAEIEFYQTSSNWRLQVGSCAGLSLGDNLLMAQYLLDRISESFGIIVKFNENYYLIESEEVEIDNCKSFKKRKVHCARGDPYYQIERILSGNGSRTNSH
jgi:hypothetical protein